MRILLVTFYYPPHVGASGRLVQELAGYLARRHTVRIVTANLAVRWLKTFEKEVVAPVRLPRFPMPATLAAILILPLFIFWALRNRREFDVIIAQHHSFHFTSAAATISGRLLRKPVVVRSEDVMRPMGVKVPLHLTMIGLLTEFLGTRATVFTVVCSEQREAILTRLRRPPNNIIIHPNFAPDSVGLEPTRLKDSDEINPTVVFVGRMTREYGLGHLLRAIPHVLNRYPSVRFVLIGDGPENLMLRSLVESLGIKRSVQFAGVCDRSQVSEWLDRATVGVGPLMPTRTLPRKVLEYAFASVPMLVGEKSVSSDFLPGKTCLEVPPEPLRIAEALIQLVGEEGLRGTLVRAAREHAGDFELEKVCGSFEKILEGSLSMSEMSRSKLPP